MTTQQATQQATQPQVYAITYRNPRDFLQHSITMAENGWRPRAGSVVQEEGHINWGRTLAKIVLTGGVGLLFGGPSRTPTKVHVVWESVH